MSLSTVTLRKSLGQRLRELRVRRGLSQRELAEPQYDGSYVSQIESGRRAPSADALQYFAHRLHVSVEELADRVPPSLRVELEMALKDSTDSMDRGDLERARLLFSRLLEIAGTSAAIDFQAEALLGLGRLDELSGEMAKALDGYRIAEELDPSEETLLRVRIALGRAYRTAGDLAYSVDLMERVLEHARRGGWAVHAVRASVQLAFALAERGDHRRARQVLDSVAKEASLLRDPMALASLHWARARNAADLGGTEDALAHIAKARALLEQQHATLELARLEGSRAFYLIEMGRADEASPILEESVNTLTLAGATLEAARLQTEQARAELSCGRAQRAREIAERALETLRGLQDPLEEAQCSLVLALALGTEARAETLLRSAAERFSEYGAREEHARALQALGEFFVATGRDGDALRTFREGLAQVVTPVIT